MRIAFYVIGNEKRSGPLTGDNIRYNGSSASGTDTSSILVAEQLALYGHEVVIACENTNVGETNRGVTYTNLNFDKIDNRNFDILVSMLWVEDYDSIPITVSRALIYWSHMQWVYSIDNIRKYVEDHNLNFAAVHVSEWEQSHTQANMDRIKNSVKEVFLDEVIGNPLPSDVINEVNNLDLTRRREKFVFHAAHARGSRLTYDTVKSLGWNDSELHLFNYLLELNLNWGRKGPDVEIDNDLILNHEGSDKFNMFKHLKESEYYIYAPFTPYENIHKDTFSCVVAEALSMGCIVITYPIGAIPGCFPDCCAWLDIPEDLNIEDIQAEALTQDPDRKFDRIDNIIDKINFLEQNPELKEELRQKSYKFVNANYNTGIIGEKWNKLIEKL